MDRKKYIFLSHVLNENTPTYANRDFFKINEKSSILKGKTANSSEWIFSVNHIGTHIDVPKHFYDDALTITDFSSEFWRFSKIGFIEVKCDEHIIISDENLFENISRDIELLLIKTGYENYRGANKYWEDNPGLAPELADFFREKFPKLRAIGFDFISLTALKNREIGKKAHLEFLNPKFPILIIEDMSLQKLTQLTSINQVIALPLYVSNSDGSPITILAEIE